MQLSIRNLTKSYGQGAPVLKDLDLEVAGSGITAIIGSSGAGKSTLLRCINRLETTDGGRIVVDNIPLTGAKNINKVRAEVGMTPASAYNHRKRWQGFARRWDEAIDIGYARIEAGLLQHACNLFSWDGPIALRPMPEMSVRDAIHLLDMHKHKVKGLGKAPGVGWRKPRSLEDPEIRGRILDALEVIERQRRAELSEEQMALDEAEWARRRGAAAEQEPDGRARGSLPDREEGDLGRGARG